LQKKTNKIAERAIKALNQELNLYANPDCNDRHFESQILLIELSLHVSVNSDTKLSPFFILHGFEMALPIQSDVVTPDTFHSREAKQYAAWLKEWIKIMYDIVRINRIQRKKGNEKKLMTKGIT